jgi:hypothetical protein
MSPWLRATLVCCLALAPSFALGDRREEAHAATDRGDRAFHKGTFAEALTEYEASYAKYPKPYLLFKIAECQRSLGKDDDALGTYKKYLEKASKGGERKKAQTQVEALTAKIATRAPEIEPEKPKPVEQASDVETPARDESQVAALEMERARAMKRERDREKANAPKETTATAPKAAPLPPGWEGTEPPVPTPSPEDPDSRVPVPTYKKWWPWTILGGGVAVGVGIAVGLVFGLPKFQSELPAGGPGASALHVRPLVRW